MKPGPGRSAAQVQFNQRARLHDAMTELAADAGFERVTVRALIRLAGVSTRSFYGQFGNREECLASSVESIGRRFLRQAADRGRDSGDREEAIRASLRSLMRDLADRPKATRLLLVETFAGGSLTRTRGTQLTGGLERLLAERLASGPAPSPPRLVCGLAAGVVHVATTTALTDRAGELPSLADPLGDWLLGMCGERAVALFAPTGRRAAGRREPAPFPDEQSGPEARNVRHGERERMLSAAARLAAAGGFESLTPSRVRREAGVSRRSFDANFSGVTECFLAAVEVLAREAAERADAWGARTEGWKARTRRTMLALCVLAARNADLAHLVLAGVLSPGRDGLLHRQRLVAAAAERLREGTAPRSARSSLAAEASIAAAWRVAQAEVVAGGARALPGAAPLLSAFVAWSPHLADTSLGVAS